MFHRIDWELIVYLVLFGGFSALAGWELADHDDRIKELEREVGRHRMERLEQIPPAPTKAP